MKFTDIPYHPDPALADNPRCQLDAYTPGDIDAPAPVLVWFHGGGLVEGSKDTDTGFAERLAERGIALVTANYRYLGPEAPFPAYIQDAARAVAWTLANAREYALDANRLFIGGASAGAYLAAMLTMDARYLRNLGVDPEQIRGSIFLSAQLTTHFHVRVQRGGPEYGIVSDEASPMFFARANTPPLLLITGDRDMPARLEENALFTALHKSLGHKDITFHVIPDRDHGAVCNTIWKAGDPPLGLILDFVSSR